MNVICIDDKDRPNDDYCDSQWVIKEGCVYTVCDVFVSRGLHCYSLAEDPYNEYLGFQSDRFIPLSNIDEEELLKERYGVEAENNFKVSV